MPRRRRSPFSVNIDLREDPRDRAAREDQEQNQRTAEELARQYGGIPEFYMQKLDAGLTPDAIARDAQRAQAGETGRQGQTAQDATIATAFESLAMNRESIAPDLPIEGFSPAFAGLLGEPEGPQIGPTLPAGEQPNFFKDFERAYPELTRPNLKDLTLDDMVKARMNLDPSSSEFDVRRDLEGSDVGQEVQDRNMLRSMLGPGKEALIEPLVTNLKRKRAGGEGTFTSSFLQKPIVLDRERVQREQEAAKHPELKEPYKSAFISGELSLDQALVRSGVLKPTREKEPGPTRTQRIKGELSKADRDLRAKIQPRVVERIGTFGEYVAARAGIDVSALNVIDPSDPTLIARQDDIREALKSVGFTAKGLENEYRSLVNEEIDHEIELMQARRLGGMDEAGVETEPVSMDAEADALRREIEQMERLFEALMEEDEF